MMKQTLLPLVLSIAFFGCGSSDRPSAPASEDTGSFEPDDTGTVDSARADSAAESAADDGVEDASSDGPSDASAEVATDGSPADTSVDAGAPLCDPTATWGTAVKVAVAAAPTARLLAITPDERTIAWVEGTGTIMYADRDSPSVAFGSGRTLAVSDVAEERVGISGDGLTLVVIRASRRAIGSVTRATRSDAFGAVLDETHFTNVKNLATFAGKNLGAPIVVGENLVFMTSLDTASQIMISKRGSDGTYAMPVAVDAVSLTGSAARLVPTGVSADLRAVFYWSEGELIERAAFRESASAPLTIFDELGAHEGAQVDATCSRLYHVAGGEIRVAPKS